MDCKKNFYTTTKTLSHDFNELGTQEKALFLFTLSKPYRSAQNLHLMADPVPSITMSALTGGSEAKKHLPRVVNPHTSAR